MVTQSQTECGPPLAIEQSTINWLTENVITRQHIRTTEAGERRFLTKNSFLKKKRGHTDRSLPYERMNLLAFPDFISIRWKCDSIGKLALRHIDTSRKNVIQKLEVEAEKDVRLDADETRTWFAWDCLQAMQI
jgi:hypothetical protein